MQSEKLKFHPTEQSFLFDFTFPMLTMNLLDKKHCSYTCSVMNRDFVFHEKSRDTQLWYEQPKNTW